MAKRRKLKKVTGKTPGKKGVRACPPGKKRKGRKAAKKARVFKTKTGGWCAVKASGKFDGCGYDSKAQAQKAVGIK